MATETPLDITTDTRRFVIYQCGCYYVSTAKRCKEYLCTRCNIINTPLTDDLKRDTVKPLDT